MPVKRLGYQEVNLDLIQRGASQARQTSVNVGIGDLVDSIRIQGLMEPVHLVEVEKDKIYELIDGQRRYQAFLSLAQTHPEKFSKIPSFIYENTMDPWEKKTMSLQANLSQEPMKQIDKVNAVTLVYNNFGSIKDTVDATGLSDSTIRTYVDTARLPEQLKNAIQKEGISMRTALDAADLYNYDPIISDAVNIAEMLETARHMQKLAGKQKRYVKEAVRQHPDKKIPDIIKNIESRQRATRTFPVVVESDTYERIDTFKQKEKIDTVSLAAVDLIHDGLDSNEV